MSAVLQNMFVTVATFQPYACRYLNNATPMIHDSNKKFTNMQDFAAQLGATVQFEKQFLTKVQRTLVANWEPTVQRYIQLTIDQPFMVPLQYSAEQLMFYDAEGFMKRRGGMAAMASIAGQVENDLGKTAAYKCFRFFGNGRSQINQIKQLSSALRKMRNYGNAGDTAKAYIPDFSIDAFIADGLNQFATARNNEFANSWELGSFSMCDWRYSNMLYKHVAGSEGQNNSTLTVVSTGVDSNNAVTSITFSGTAASNDVDSVKKGDKFRFNLTGAAANLYYLILGTDLPSYSPVEFVATADAAAVGGEVTVNIDPPLQAASGVTQNITDAIVAGMTVEVADSHVFGAVTQGDSLFLAMPRLPDQTPFPSSSTVDEKTGMSVRFSHGATFAQNVYGYTFDGIYGTQLNGENAMGILFPLAGSGW